MIKRKKGKDHERVKEKALRQPLTIKERKGSKMAVNRKGQ
jgi:hypothetical protein